MFMICPCEGITYVEGFLYKNSTKVVNRNMYYLKLLKRITLNTNGIEHFIEYVDSLKYVIGTAKAIKMFRNGLSILKQLTIIKYYLNCPIISM